MIRTTYALSTNITFNRQTGKCTRTPLALSKHTGGKTIPLFDLLPHEHTDALNLAAEMNRIRARKT
jgi:hypothetical protein